LFTQTVTGTIYGLATLRRFRIDRPRTHAARPTLRRRDELPGRRCLCNFYGGRDGGRGRALATPLRPPYECQSKHYRHSCNSISRLNALVGRSSKLVYIAGRSSNYPFIECPSGPRDPRLLTANARTRHAVFFDASASRSAVLNALFYYRGRCFRVFARLKIRIRTEGGGGWGQGISLMISVMLWTTISSPSSDIDET